MFGIPLHCLRTPVSSDPSTAVLVELCRLPAFIQVPVKRLLLLCCCCCRCCGCCCGSEFYFTYSTHTYVVFVVFSLVLADLLRHTKRYTLHHYGYIAAALLGCGRPQGRKQLVPSRYSRYSFAWTVRFYCQPKPFKESTRDAGVSEISVKRLYIMLFVAFRSFLVLISPGHRPHPRSRRPCVLGLLLFLGWV